MTNLVVFRPKSSIALAAIAGVLEVLYLIQLTFYSERLDLAGYALAAFAATVVWAVFVRPKFLIYDEGVTIVNPLTTTVIPLSEIQNVNTRFALTITARDRRFSVWAATAPGRYQSKRVRTAELFGSHLHGNEFIGAGDSPSSHSGEASIILHQRIKVVGHKASNLKLSTSVNRAAAGALVATAVLLGVLSVVHF